MGRLPEMLCPEDFIEGGLDEKAVVLYVAHLACRMLEMSKEERAAATITQALRSYLWAKKYGKHCLFSHLTLAHTYCCSQMTGAITIGSFCTHGHHSALPYSYTPLACMPGPELERIRNQSATVFQKYWRRYRAMQQLKQLKQERIEHEAREAEARRHAAATAIQVRWWMSGLLVLLLYESCSSI